MKIRVVLNLSHYQFFTVADPAAARDDLEARLVGTRVVGTVLIAREGVNFNLAGSDDELRVPVTAWLAHWGCDNFAFKESISQKPPFKRLKIKVKAEIVRMGVDDLDTQSWTAPHLPATEFRRLLRDEPENLLILDTRNDFEYEMGTFRGAQPVRMNSFREFPAVAAQLPRDKQVVMFCTGGIRCEKASAYLRREGFADVLQLDGGILRYFEECGGEGFEGQCFVFDERRAVDGQLTPAPAGTIGATGPVNPAFASGSFTSGVQGLPKARAADDND